MVASEPANAASGSNSILHEAKALAEPAVGEHDRGCRRERAAGGDADQRGIGQRIAKQALHDGAGHREQGADHGGRRDARNPDRPQHQLVARRQRIGGGVRAEAERSRQPGERNAGCAHGERDKGGGRERDQQEQGSGKGRRTVAATARRGARAVRLVASAHCRQFAVDESRREGAALRRQRRIELDRRDRAPPRPCAGRSRADRGLPSR